MKIGMNSQCIRVIGNGIILDYHITSGQTATMFLEFVGGKTPHSGDFYGYACERIYDESTPMSWGSDVDKMTDINMVNLDNNETGIIIDDYQHDPHAHLAPPPPSRAPSGAGQNFYTPSTAPVKMTPPPRRTPAPPQYNYSKTEQNDETFGRLFGA